MSNNVTKTGAFLGVTSVLVLISFLTGPRFSEPEAFDDKGQEFFPDFEDPTQPVALEIVEYEAETAQLRPFKVQVKKDRWTIPSHHDYPADGKERMAEAAGFFIGLKKDDIRSDSSADHALFGVLHPQEEGLETEGRGTLVTFKDTAGNDLASLILGKEVEGREGMRYVRVPEKKRTYASKLPGELSTNFADWIETDLLQLTSTDLETLRFDNYSIDETTFAVTPNEVVIAKKEDYDWAVDGLAENEETKKDELQTAASTLDQLKIVGVRPKPTGLSASLTRASEIEMTAQSAMSLRSRGYFLGRDGTLYSNEGDLTAMTKEGLVYTLRFGEVLYGTGESVTAGGDDPAEKKESGEDDSSEEESGVQANRYLMVTANFDENLLEKPGEPALSADHLTQRQEARTSIEEIVSAIEKYRTENEKLPETLALLTEGDDPPLAELSKDPWDRDFVFEVKEEDEFIVASLSTDGTPGGAGEGEDISSDQWDRETALRKIADDWKAYEDKVKEGHEDAGKLSKRFAPWYYVIEDESFKKLHLSRAQVVTQKEPDPDSEAGSPVVTPSETPREEGSPAAGSGD